MRFATFQHNGNQLCGALSPTEDKIHPFPQGTTLLHLVEQSEQDLRQAGAAALDTATPVALTDVRLLPPLQPPTIRDFMTFEQHLEGMAQGFGDSVPDEWYAQPAFYFSNPYSVVGAHDDVAVPPGCERFDFELEVAAVIGKAGRDLSPERAREHIVGYTILNDWSARDLQGFEMKVKLGPAKGKDSATTLGPWLVTTDELEAARGRDGRLDLNVLVKVNDDVIGWDNLCHMAWTFEEMAAYASRGTEVRPGDVLGSGTCGNGCLAEFWGRRGKLDPPPLVPGDVVTLAVEGLGSISNTVVAGTEPVPIPTARRPGTAGRTGRTSPVRLRPPGAED
ncbi:fumarylacetoacetate hydrolase family protein [Streptomyces sp. S3(2020)]|uniref:fumarylacetoacetate hydrolase family protein n=1 Tax=Streptomyces sp. S3(2020) TaxID=2732044 RepID=UPI0014884A51|nr:fumarylacetoacetate hydrolase family protein [Streptomyces sp. S3(2020)]NNN29699.1 fumarylacetoacetate hydrolase family protein [Streptomyces sp. S3(2020)]